MPVKQLMVIHPFLFGIFSILFLFAYNIDEVPASDLLLPILIVIALTLILLLSSRLITKNYSKSAIITSYFLILFFSYGYIEPLILSLGLGRFVGNHTMALSLVLWALIFSVGAFLVIKSGRNFLIFTKFLNIMAITLVAISLVNIGIYEVANNLGHGETNKGSNSLIFEKSDNMPDIYYIILDSYTRQDTLEELYNYDNSQFTDYLTSKGFYVATKSCSNYGTTLYSLPSSLNMKYLTTQEKNNATVRREMIFNSEVSQFLKSKGYNYIFIVSSVYLEKGASKYADAYVPARGIFGDTILTISDFTTSLIGMTPLQPFLLHYYYGSATTRKSVLYAFDKLADMPNISGPKFIFAHILPPHPPNIFDRDGNPATQETSGYIDQLIFVNKKVEALVNEILIKSDVAPIIILQGDTGAMGAPKGYHYHILNAYYLPGKDNRVLYETITPVNSFRIILNLYFDTGYELLEDISPASIP